MTHTLIDIIETIAADAEPLFDIDALFDRFECDRDAADYPFSVEDDLAFIDSELGRLDALAEQLGEDLLDNVAEDTRESLRARRKALR